MQLHVIKLQITFEIFLIKADRWLQHLQKTNKLSVYSYNNCKYIDQHLIKSTCHSTDCIQFLNGSSYTRKIKVFNKSLGLTSSDLYPHTSKRQSVVLLRVKFKIKKNVQTLNKHLVHFSVKCILWVTGSGMVIAPFFNSVIDEWLIRIMVSWARLVYQNSIAA